MKKLHAILISCLAMLAVQGQKTLPFNGLDVNLGNLYRLSDAKTEASVRRISPASPAKVVWQHWKTEVLRKPAAS